MSNSERQSQRSLRVMAFAASGLAILFACAVAEIALRLTGIGDPLSRRDPFEGFAGSSPAFQRIQGPGGGDIYTPAPNKARIKVSFAAEKPPGAFRVFSFGGSTTEGAPFGRAGSFSRWLEDDLRRLYPDRHIEVINLGLSGIGSARVLQLLLEAIRYEPDLFAVYTGQNEFRDAFFHRAHVTRSAWRTQLLKWLYSSRVVYLAREGFQIAWAAVFGPPQVSYGGALIGEVTRSDFSAETFAAYDYYTLPTIQIQRDVEAQRSPADGMKRLVKSLLGMNVSMPAERVYEIYQANIRQMVDAARNNSVPLILMEKAQNPKAYNRLVSPVYEVRQPPDSAQAGQWELAYREALAAMHRGDCNVAESSFKKALALIVPSEDRYTPLYLGECAEKRAAWKEARSAYRSRLLVHHRELNRRLRKVADELDVPLIKTFTELEAAAENGIVGYHNFFVDNAHLTLPGYALMADRLSGLIRSGNFGLPAQVAGVGIQSAVREQDFRTLRSEPKALTALAWAAFNQGQSDRALKIIKRVLAEDPNEIQARLLLGYVYTDLNLLEEARAEWALLRELYAELQELEGGGV